MPEAGAIHLINGGEWLALEIGNDSFRFKVSAARRKTKKESVQPFTKPKSKQTPLPTTRVTSR